MIGYLDLFNNFNAWSFVEAYIQDELNKTVWNDSNEIVLTVGVDDIGKIKHHNQFSYGKNNAISYDSKENIYTWFNDYINKGDSSKRNQSLEDFVEDLKYNYELDLLDNKMMEIEDLGFYINIGENTEFKCVYKKSPNNIEFIVTEKFLVIRDLINNETCVIYNEKDMNCKNLHIKSFIYKERKMIKEIMDILNFPK